MKTFLHTAGNLLCLLLLLTTVVTMCCACASVPYEPKEESTTGYHYGNNVFYYKDDTVYRLDCATGREYILYQFEYPCDTVIFEENNYLCLSGGALYSGTYDGFVRRLYGTEENGPYLTAYIGNSGDRVYFSTDDAVYPYAELNRTDGTCRYLKSMTDLQPFNDTNP